MNLHRLPLCAVAATLALGQLSLYAQTTVATDPVGFVTTSIPGSTSGTSWKITPVSPVLVQASGVTGTAAGQLTTVSSNQVTVTSAGWAVDSLPSSDGYLLLKSGQQSGLVARITGNTADTLTLDTFGVSLSGVGVASGDSFQIVQGDTILSMFGTSDSGVVGGNSSAYNAGTTDRVIVRDASGISRTLYFNTQFNQWRRSGSGNDQGTIPISPYAGVFYYRISTAPLSFVTTGAVPTTALKVLIPKSGTTFLGRFYPTDGTLNGFGFQSLPGWKTTDTVTTTDASGVVRTYYHNGIQWLRKGSGSSQNDVAIPIGGAVQVFRSGTTVGADILGVTLPYTL